jgi:hypothetical protein
MTISTPEAPRNGSYVAAFAYTDQEGGGDDLQARMKECPTCHAMVAEAGLDSHVGRHEAVEGGGSQPKSRL